MSQQGYIGRNPGDGRTIVNRQTTHVTTGVQTSFTMTVGYEVGYLDVYLNGIKQTETLDYTASDGSTIDFSLSFPPVNGDVLEFVAFETLNITNIKSARRNFSVGQDLDVSGKVTIGSSLTVASDLVVNGTFTTINTEILDVEDKTVGIASTSSPSNTTANGAGIVIYGGSDGDKSLTWNSTKSNFVLVGGGVSIGTGVTISTPAANVLAFSVNSAEKARFNNFGAFTVGYEGEAWHESTYVGVLQAGSGAWIGQTPGASARAEWVNNAYYDSVNTRWEYIAADEANRIVLENGELKVQSADAGSADGAITWNEKLKMTVGGDFKIGAPTGIGITISSSGNIDAIGITTVGGLTVTGNTTIGGDLNTNTINITDVLAHQGDGDTRIRFPAADTFTVETAGSEVFRVTSGRDIVTQGLTDHSFNNDGDNAKVLEVTGDGTVGEYGVVNISGNQNSSAVVGAIKFLNRENSNSSSGSNANSKRLASIDCFADTSDSNGGDDSGGFLRFVTKADGGGGGERLRIGSAGQLGIAGANYGTSGQVLTSGGSGSAISWSTITGTTINSNADNRIITGSGTANTLNAEDELTYSTYLSLIRANSDTNFGDNSSPGGVNGIFINNSQSTNGVFSAITLSANDVNGTNQSGSFIAKSSSGGYTPEVHITQRTGANTNESNFKITTSRAVEIRYQGSTKLATTSSGVTVTGGVTCDGVSVSDNEVIALGNSTDLKLYHDSGNNYVGSPNSQSLVFFTNNTSRWKIEHDGHMVPIANNSYDFGSSTYRVRNIYTNDLNLSNKGSQNDVDGTWGDYTIQEGESDLFLINNRSGKKFKFMLQEVS